MLFYKIIHIRCVFINPVPLKMHNSEMHCVINIQRHNFLHTPMRSTVYIPICCDDDKSSDRLWAYRLLLQRMCNLRHECEICKIQIYFCALQDATLNQESYCLHEINAFRKLIWI